MEVKYYERFLIKTLLGLFIMLAVGTASPQQAEAVNVKLINPLSKAVFTAIRYREDSTRKWIVQGWFKVEPKSTRILSFPTSMEYVNIYAHTSDKSWEAK